MKSPNVDRSPGVSDNRIVHTLSRYRLSIIIGLSLLVHAGLFLHDLQNPKAYLIGDRATQRIAIIEEIMRASTEGAVVDAMVQAGNPGDYIFHALPYAWYGLPGVIVMQVLLQLIAIAYVYRIGQLVLSNSALPALAAAIYAFLPAGLLHPHVLMTEALFIPLVISAFYHTVRYLMDTEAPTWHLVVAALIGSLAAFIRPIYVLYPLILVGILLLLARRPHIYSRAIVYLILSWTIPLLWASFMFVQTGNFSMGESGHSLGGNLYGRVERMSRKSDIEIAPDHQQRKRLQLTQYLVYVSEHPVAYLNTLSSDLFNITFNSGTNLLLGRYLGLYDMPKKTKYWRDIRDKEGIWAMVKATYEYTPALFVVNLVATPLWVGFIGLALFGLYLVLRNPRLPPAVKALMVTLPGYMVLVSQTAISVRWGFRTPIEFVLVLLFVVSAARLFQSHAGKEQLRDSDETR